MRNGELADIIERAASGAIDRHKIVGLLRPYITSTEELKQAQKKEVYEVFDPADYL